MVPSWRRAPWPSAGGQRLLGAAEPYIRWAEMRIPKTLRLAVLGALIVGGVLLSIAGGALLYLHATGHQVYIWIE